MSVQHRGSQLVYGPIKHNTATRQGRSLNEQCLRKLYLIEAHNHGGMFSLGDSVSQRQHVHAVPGTRLATGSSARIQFGPPAPGRTRCRGASARRRSNDPLRSIFALCAAPPWSRAADAESSPPRGSGRRLRSAWKTGCSHRGRYLRGGVSTESTDAAGRSYRFRAMGRNGAPSFRLFRLPTRSSPVKERSRSAAQQCRFPGA